MWALPGATRAIAQPQEENGRCDMKIVITLDLVLPFLET
jgi:hypothetical protein